MDGETQHASSAPQRPNTDSHDAWQSYWQALDQPWRTEPEIDDQRQGYLAKLRAIVPDIARGIYPFAGVQLTRGDIEWLLATHADGRGPVDWNDPEQRQRQGLDLGRSVVRSRVHRCAS